MGVDIAGYYDEAAEPQADFSPVPAGSYRAEIVESEIEDISKRDSKGRCLKLTWKIVDGEFAGRLIWQRLNMWAENMNNLQKVVEIANQQFASIRDATGVSHPRNTDELHARPCMLTVSVKTDPNGQYAPANEVKRVAGVNAAPAAAPRQAAAPAAKPAPRPAAAPAPAGRAAPRPAPAPGATAPWRGAPQPATAGVDDEIPF